MPSITPDKDQVESFKSTRTGTSKADSNTTQESNVQSDQPNSKSKTSSPLNNVITFLLLISFSGSVWWFYQEHIKTQQLLDNASQRIQLLEQQLSATGEEMGESEVAMKVRLEGLTEKTDKLWQEMDKLWASAWRRNQADVKALRSKMLKQAKVSDANSKKLDNVIVAVTELTEKQTSTDFNINALGDQISAANKTQAEIKALSDQFTALKEQSLARDQQQMEVATSVNELDMSVQLLLERLEKLEAVKPIQAAKATPPPAVNNL
jgi:hypothetical protein